MKRYKDRSKVEEKQVRRNRREVQEKEVMGEKEEKKNLKIGHRT